MDGLLFKIKENFIIRTICKPFVDLKRIIERKRYIYSLDSNFIKSLKNSYSGKSCFIIGNGPSLNTTDLESIKDEISFASNRIYNIFDKTSWRPTFYLAVDPDFVKSNLDQISKVESKYKFISSKGKLKNGEVKHLVRIFEYTKFKINKWNDKSAFISEDVSEFFSVGYTVTFTALQLAIYMGFKNIYLLGVDFNYSNIKDAKGKSHTNNLTTDYFYNKKEISTVLNYESCLYAYKQAYKYAKNNGINIFNATRGGKLEVFDRVNLDDILKKFNEETKHV